jgi:excisionase family DNA binding protein
MASAKAAEHGGRTVHPNYRWISSVRAAERLGLSIRDLYRLIDRGELPAYRIASEIRLLSHEVEDFHDKFPRPRDLL